LEIGFYANTTKIFLNIRFSKLPKDFCYSLVLLITQLITYFGISVLRLFSALDEYNSWTFLLDLFFNRAKLFFFSFFFRPYLSTQPEKLDKKKVKLTVKVLDPSRSPTLQRM
jgi:hypothetical protein